jgi:HK97 family phage prohead protease
MSNLIERRFIGSKELRASTSTNGKRILSGYAAKYNRSIDPKMASALGFNEQCAPGAFDRSISNGDDVLFLRDHNKALLMGRTKSGTLSLKSDAVGLRFTCELPNTQSATELHELVSRGDLPGCSFSFAVAKGGQRFNKVNGQMTRILTDVNLFDVSVVAEPAYPDTSVVADRGREDDDDCEDEDCDERMVAAYFPAGIPLEVRSHFPRLESISSKVIRDPELDLMWMRLQLAKIDL